LWLREALGSYRIIYIRRYDWLARALVLTEWTLSRSVR
jgi:hypothetical protein